MNHSNKKRPFLVVFCLGVLVGLLICLNYGLGPLYRGIMTLWITSMKLL